MENVSALCFFDELFLLKFLQANRTGFRAFFHDHSFDFILFMLGRDGMGATAFVCFERRWVQGNNVHFSNSFKNKILKLEEII